MHITKILVMIYLTIGFLLVNRVNKNNPEILDDSSFAKSVFVMITYNIFWLPLFFAVIVKGGFKKRGE